MKRAVVIGAARSGMGAANLLSIRGHDVTITDKKSRNEIVEALSGLRPNVKLALGGHPDDLFRDAGLVVVSPGVPVSSPVVELARESGAEVIGELELAWRFIKDIPIYAITGTNGKSTTVTLLHLMMQKSGKRSFLGGNIGYAICGELAEKGGQLDVDCIVAEVSSFQLETIVDFRPRGAAVLNVTPDHLDRHGSMQGYRQAKARISLNQTDRDFLVLNADDPETMVMYEEMAETCFCGRPERPKVYYFSRASEAVGVYLKDGLVYQNATDSDSALINANDIRIKGVHNLENAMAASLMALLAGCPVKAVRDVLMEFQGLEHRCELVRELDGVKYINDSKGTNVDAAIKSIESFAEPIILIAGGRDKAGDFKALAKAMRGRVKTAVLIGEASRKMLDAFSGIMDCRVAGSDFSRAVQLAKELASPGDVVLLSPACASFDMFSNFEDRGAKFKTLVREL